MIRTQKRLKTIYYNKTRNNIFKMRWANKCLMWWKLPLQDVIENKKVSVTQGLVNGKHTSTWCNTHLFNFTCKLDFMPNAVMPEKKLNMQW